MEPEDNPQISVNPGYVVAQLSRAITAASEHPDPAVRQRAVERATRWQQVFEAMLSGAISFGSRAPVSGVPEWVTLEVLHGGFASGNLLAGGPVQAHELDLIKRLELPPENTGRAALNIYYLSDAGRLDLLELLQNGCYRVNVPEEGALPVVAWLLSRNMTEQAQELIDSIAPFFDRLRFYPVPNPNPIVQSSTVHRHTVGQAVTAIRERRRNPQVGPMLEALKIWQPLYDRTVSLFLETIDGDYPCRKYPANWRTRAQALLDEYAALRKVHTLCAKPDRPKENFARLRTYLKICIENVGQVTARDASRIRHILRGYIDRHGSPGSEEFARRRAAQAHIAGLPAHDDLAHVLIGRLEQFPDDGGIRNIESVVRPVAAHESLRFKIAADTSIPKSMVRKARRCWDASIGQLIETGIVTSADVLASVLPQITSQSQSAGLEDANLRRLYAAIYGAFRRRRSLLLLNLDRQVRFEDLPWVVALKSLKQFDAKTEARHVLEEVTTTTIVSFPQAILPNKLLQELRALIKEAGLSIPIVDELAADIFMGTFTEKFLRSSQIAAHLLTGSLYERYFGVPWKRVLELDDLQTAYGASVSPGFAALCRQLAGVVESEGRSVSRNGKIIEQSQILTTHNLAALIVFLNLQPTLVPRLRGLAEMCFRCICGWRITPSWKANLRMAKNAAYAWRQMVFFLALLDADAVDSFLAWAQSYVRALWSLGQRLDPALAGLEWIVNGHTFDERGVGGKSGEGRRFLGWTTERHWFLGPQAATKIQG